MEPRKFCIAGKTHVLMRLYGGGTEEDQQYRRHNYYVSRLKDFSEHDVLSVLQITFELHLRTIFAREKAILYLDQIDITG